MIIPLKVSVTSLAIEANAPQISFKEAFLYISQESVPHPPLEGAQCKWMEERKNKIWVCSHGFFFKSCQSSRVKWCNMGDWHLKTGFKSNASFVLSPFYWLVFMVSDSVIPFHYHHPDGDQRDRRRSVARFVGVSCQSRRGEIYASLIRGGFFFFVIIQDIICVTPNRWIMDCQEAWNAFLGMSLLFICFVCRSESRVKSCHKSFLQTWFGITVIRMSTLLSCWVMSRKVSWPKGKFHPKLK